MKKIIITVFVIFGLGIGVFLANIFSDTKEQALIIPVAETLAETTSPTPLTISKPITFTIPKINVETTIESVAHDAVGNMDVPKDAANVAWYNPGVKPGEKGNAVLAGHFDDPNGDAAVFFNLDDLEEGDTLEVTDEQNKKYIFTVTHKESYPVDEFPISTVFGPADGSHLNLITCEGTFDNTAATYTHRLVVFSELTEVRDI